MGPLPTDTDQLLFPAVQTYDDGAVVRWDQPPAGRGCAGARAPRAAGRLVPAIRARLREHGRRRGGYIVRGVGHHGSLARRSRAAARRPRARASGSVRFCGPAARDRADIGIRRALAVLSLAGLTLLVGAGPAAAHNVLLGSDPPEGASVPAGPSRVSLRFDLPVRDGFNTLIVVGPDGLAYQSGAPEVTARRSARRSVQLGPAGRYEIRYRIVSDDGHPVSGNVGFTLTTAGTGTGRPVDAGSASAPAPTGDGSGGMALWPWLVAAAVLVAGGVLVAVRLGR